MGNWSDDTTKTIFIEKFEKHLIRLDENSAIFEFERSVPLPYMLNRELQSLLMQLELSFTDWQVVIVRRTGQSVLQVQLRLEEGLWKPR